MAQLSPSAVFSPSVARQQLAAARDWNYIDNWLTAKFSNRSPPPFERNPETLKALLALASLNESADEERDLLARVNAKALQEFKEQEASDPDADLFRALEDSLFREGKASLEALSEISVSLNQPRVDTEQLARKILDLQTTTHNLDQAVDRVNILQKNLSAELTRVKALLEELQSDRYQPSSDLSKETLDKQRKTKVLAAKLPELKDRMSSLTAATGSKGPTIQEVRAEEDRFKGLMATVKDLEAQVRSYHGLPHDTDLARLEVERLRAELRELSEQRDSMFEGLVERESPKKVRSQK